MNVFILDTDMYASAKMLDDAHLRAQINEGVQILMTVYNMRSYPDTKIGYAKHPVVKGYDRDDRILELASYVEELLIEYRYRFRKYHSNWFWVRGFIDSHLGVSDELAPVKFDTACTYIGKKNGGYIFTNDPAQVRSYIMAKPVQKAPVWTRRARPEWWSYYTLSSKTGNTRKIQFSTREAVKE